MLTFVVPLRSRAASNDWKLVSALCVRTLRSCCRQTSNDFRVVLVGNERPDLPDDLKNLTVIEEEFPIPTTKDEMRVDKYAKIQRALIHLRDAAPFYWAKVDSDDCVSNRLCDYVEFRPKENGWFFPKGYIYTMGSSHVYAERSNFFRVCGTSTIMWADSKAMLPSSLDEPRSNFDYLNISHSDIPEHMKEIGRPLRALPFYGAVYCVGHGENLSGFGGVQDFKSMKWKLRQIVNRKPLADKLRLEFGLSEI